MRVDTAQILHDLPEDPDFFDGFEEHRIDIPGSHVFCRTKGDGMPLLLLHGYPQTSAMWHKVAPALAETYRVICPDLRGYGRSATPATDDTHRPYSKRAMGNDLIALMDHLGHGTFLIGAHDRGGRVGHRMAADHPDRVTALSVLDIAPTREMYRDATSAFAAAYWHWFWLIQPAPMPETLIGYDPDAFWIKKCFAGSAGSTPFSRNAVDEYLTAFRDPLVIHGACEDYRAAFTIDIADDDADPSMLKMPMQALWGSDGVIEAHFDCLALWRERANDVQGQSLPGGHYLAEENPEAVLGAWRSFFPG